MAKHDRLSFSSFARTLSIWSGRPSAFFAAAIAVMVWGGNGTILSLQRHLAVGHQYVDDDCDLFDGVLNSECTKPRHRGDST